MRGEFVQDLNTDGAPFGEQLLDSAMQAIWNMVLL
jgi:hypothetical protein